MGQSRAKQILYWIWAIMAIIIILSLLLTKRTYAQDPKYSNLSEKEQEIAEKMEKKYLGMNEFRTGKETEGEIGEEERVGNHIERYFGDVEIASDKVIGSDILVVKGTLTLYGQVEGTILTLFGDIHLEADAYVEGDVVCVDGKIWKDRNAFVEGDIIERQSSNHYNRVSDEERQEQEIHVTTEHHRPKRKIVRHNFQSDHEPVYADYNRVDGLTLGFNFPSSEWWRKEQKRIGVIGKVGYSFSSKNIQYQIGLERCVFPIFACTVGAEAHDMTDTQDRWIISDLENALGAFLINEDFRDYYKREGFSIYAKNRFFDQLSLKFGYHNDKINNLEKNTEWAVFGKSKDFRPNPWALPYGYCLNEIAAGNDPHMNLQSYSFNLVYDTRDDDENPERGWFINLFAEKAGNGLKSDLDFQRQILDVRRYQPLGWDEGLDLRLRIGSSNGVLPPMYWFDLGGLSTLRGYRHKEFTGDRMLLANIEYTLETSELDWTLFDEMNLVLFVDSGCAWFAESNTPEMQSYWPMDPKYVDKMNEKKLDDSFSSLTWSSLKTNVGIGLSSDDDDFRINFAKRTDVGDGDIVVTIRLKKEF